jgi:ribosome biogenesis protein Nip4
MVHSPSQLSKKLRQFEEQNKAMVCINDDQPDGIGEAKRQDTKERFAAWMKMKWGGEGSWDDWEIENASWIA